MKSHKRDKAARAYSRGYAAGLQGKSRELCPYTSHAIKQDWVAGWRDGRQDHWNGLTPATALLRNAS